MSARYTYLFADLLTNAVLAELPLERVRLGRVLGGAGSFAGVVDLTDARVRSMDPINATEQNRRVVYVARDGELLPMAYWLRIRRYRDGKLALAGTELWSYFAQRLIRSTLTFDQVDQATIVADIIAALQALPSGDIGLAVSAAATGVLRDRTYYGYELKYAAEAIEQLAEVIDGFEFAVDVTGDETDPTKTLVVSYPRRGIQAFETDLLFEKPGNVIGFEWPEDGTRQADVSIAVGAGEGDDMLLAVATSEDALDEGYPLLERSISYKDIRDLEYLQAHADTDVDASAWPVTIPSLVVRGDVDPIVGSYDIGDDCRIVLTDDRFPDGLDYFARIVGLDIQPEDPESGLEQVDLALGEVAA